MQTPNFDQLLDATCHFGHLKRKWNPAMAPYIFMERNGIHIIDLYKKQAKDVTKERAMSVDMPYVIERWPGGMLTNFATIRKAVKKMDTIDKMETDGTMDNMSKREKLQLSRQRAKLEKNLGSIKNLNRLPSALFVVDVLKEHIAVAEANRLGIPVFGIVDTNSDPSNVDFVIPANDDASKSIDIILATVCEAIKEGLEERKVEQIDNKDEEAEAEEAKDAPKPRRQRVRRASAKAEEAPAAEEAPKTEE